MCKASNASRANKASNVKALTSIHEPVDAAAKLAFETESETLLRQIRDEQESGRWIRSNRVWNLTARDGVPVGVKASSSREVLSPLPQNRKRKRQESPPRCGSNSGPKQWRQA